MSEEKELDVLLDIRTILEAGLERSTSNDSSIVIEDQVKGPKVTTKVYVGSPLTREQVDRVLEIHGYAHREAERLSMNGWQETVDMLEAAGKNHDVS